MVAACVSHAIFKRRKDAQLSDAQAEAIVSAVQTTATLPDGSQLATKGDLDQLWVATKADFEQLRVAAKADLINVETKLGARITALKGELVGWIIGTGAVVAASQTLQPLFGK